MPRAGSIGRGTAWGQSPARCCCGVCYPALMPSLLITGGRVIDPGSSTDRTADVAIHDGKVAAIGEKLTRSPAGRVIDAEGCLVTPGLIDPHVHLREPGQAHKAP